ncbi:elongation factor P [Calditrichota bacterium]
MATTAEIKNGVVIDFEGTLCTVVEFQHVKPGKGGAFVRTKMKAVQSGKVLDKTFRSGEKIEIVRLEAREMQYLYNDGDAFVFMDQQTFDQVNIPTDVVGDNSRWLKEGEAVKILFHGDVPLITEVPNFIVFEITECQPGVKGDTVSNVYKPATLETGAVVQVPLFVEQGESIRVDTRTGEYLDRSRD